jgi:hypothetical protein
MGIPIWQMPKCQTFIEAGTAAIPVGTKQRAGDETEDDLCTGGTY